MLVRAKSAFYSTATDAGGVLISPADTLREDNPHVKAYPDLFEPVTDTIDRGGAGGVEQATARPGDKRNR